MLDMLILPLVWIGCGVLLVSMLLNHRLNTGTFSRAYRLIEEHSLTGYKCMRVETTTWYDPFWNTRETFTIEADNPNKARVKAAEYFDLLIANNGKYTARTVVRRHP